MRCISCGCVGTHLRADGSCVACPCPALVERWPVDETPAEAPKAKASKKADAEKSE